MTKFCISAPKTIDPVATGKKIRRLLRERGVTVSEMAELLCLSEQALYKWFSGKSVPTVDNLGTVADALDVTMEYLIVWYPQYEHEKEEDDMSSSYLFYAYPVRYA